MEIQIPSPSVFLAKSPPLPTAHAVQRERSAVAVRNTGAQPDGASLRSTPTTRDGALATAKQSKSRNGCTTCKKKRLKCDETKPSCAQCHKRNVVCAGYQKDYKWRTFEETKAKSRPIPTRSTTPPPSHADAQVLNGSADAVDAYGHGGGVDTSAVNQAGLDTFTLSPTWSHRLVSAQDQPGQRRLGSLSSPDLQSFLSLSGAPSSHLRRTSSSTFMPSFNANSPGLSFREHVEPTKADVSTAQSSAIATDNSTQSYFSHSPLPPGPSPMGEMSHPFDSSELQPPVSPPTYRRSAFEAHIDAAGSPEGAVGRAGNSFITSGLSLPSITTFLTPRNATTWQPSRPSSLLASEGSSRSSDADSSTIRKRTSSNVSSPEMLMLRFDQQTCSILSIKDGPSENPWRTLLWPLTRECRALYHAIASLTAFHGAHEDRLLHTPGMEHMTKSMRYLAAEIESMPLDYALATSLALAFGEGWESPTSSGVQHLRAASVMAKDLAIKHRLDMHSRQLSSHYAGRVKFLCNTFVYMDVIARLTSFEEGSDINIDEILSTVNAPFEDQIEIDPQMGCAVTLFPLIGRVANLIQRVRKTELNSLNLVSAAMELKEQVEKWQVHGLEAYERPEDPNCEIQHCIQTAEAYRYATLLYLHQAVPEIPSESAQTLARKVLLKLASVPLSSSTIIVQIFPLFAASCEITDPDDRDWIMQRWAALTARLKIGNVKCCLGVVQEVWDRRDTFEDERASRAFRRNRSRTMPGDSLTTSGSQISTSLKRKPQQSENSNSMPSSWGSSTGDELDSKGRPLKRRVTSDSLGAALPMSLPANFCGGCGSMIPTNNTGYGQNRRLPGDHTSSSQLEPEYTVRGQLHWLSVMREWRWEVFL